VALLCFNAIERAPPALVRTLAVFGSVPLFAYIAHIYFVHALSLALHAAAGQSTDAQWDAIRNLFLHPQSAAGTGLALPWVYGSWVVTVIALYPLCLWMSRLKARHPGRWVSFI